MNTGIINYLALGDSYTIGEAVPAEENFPNRLYHLAIESGIKMERPRIIARTGWTTDELMAAINKAGKEQPFLNSYQLVTLLIGVNNQYRGRSVENYEFEFRELLERALDFAGGQARNVIVLSIPDWSVTPFARDRDQALIAREIDDYNEANRSITEDLGIHYIYITDLSRQAAEDPSLLAADGLHPSAIDYERWSRKILSYIKKILGY